MSPLHRLSRKVGLVIDWQDAAGERHRVSDESLILILQALGFPAGTVEDIADSETGLQVERREQATSFLTTEASQALAAPAALRRHRCAQLFLESGERREFVPANDIPPIEEPGYHRIEAGDLSITFTVAPPRAFTVTDATGGRSIWAPAVQIPSLRGTQGAGFGDFGALAEFAGAAGHAGADALAISPVHALFPADPARYSPYAPSSRFFLNVLLADASQLGGGEAGGDLIDWTEAIPAKMRLLRQLFEAQNEKTREAVASYRQAGGRDLERHACFDALHAHFFLELGSHGWQAWPERYHDPDSEAVREFARDSAQEVEFYAFLQWLAEESLESAQAVAKRSGMAAGLIADMAVGVDAGGSQAWSRPGTLLSGLSVGAPPDPLGPDGQDWGVTTFSPPALRRTGFRDFLSTIRAALRHSGGLRIDHAMSLRRLWVVPHGVPSSHGAYLRYPEQDMMRLLALESYRASALVVGEDLGTIPMGFRPEMDRRGFLGMRVLWFERTRSGGFRSAVRWTPEAAGMTSTHDLPTVAGWWQGSDIGWNWSIGRTSSFPSRQAESEARAEDRARLWRACRREGIATGSEPPADEPEEAVTAAVSFVASAPCALTIIPAEDLFGISEQPNLPGTTTEHPNWRRRLPGPTSEELRKPAVARRIAKLNQGRKQ